MSILLTGGLGYIGSHTAVELVENGNDVIIVDNLVNSSMDMLDRLETITDVRIKFYNVDVANARALDRIFAENEISAVIHFAGLKAVGESVEIPIKYYRNNIDTTLTLLEKMEKYGVKQIVFSSSATVYGANNHAPYIETMHTGGCTNPYGWTKHMNEQILIDATVADPNLSVVILRYFNPIGAHESGLIGEKPNGTPNNLMPYITQTAIGIRKKLSIFGDDYPTCDGTGVRDYIHVVDLAKGHVVALVWVEKHKGSEIFNLGTGIGYSVLEVVDTFCNVNNVDVPYVIADRRAGDIAECYANTEKAKNILGWKAHYGIREMCRDSWKWQINNGIK